MPKVHPTAIIDDRAVLADDVEVGPQCVIEGAVTIGAGTRLLHRVSLHGPLTLGERNVIYPNVLIGYEPQDRKFDPATQTAGSRIGDDNIFREGFTLHRATGERPTTLGSGGYYMANSHVAHDCQVGDGIMFANSVLLGGHVEIGDKVVIGGNGVVHQHCRVGRLSIIAGLRGVNKDLPPFCLTLYTMQVNALNLIGLRRAGYRADIDALKRAFDIFFRRGLPTPEGLARIKADACFQNERVREFTGFIEQAKRGITPYAVGRDHRASED